MKCPKCGTSIPSDQTFCSHCGTRMPSFFNNQIVLYITKKEAKQGCQRFINPPGLLNPLRLTLPPDIPDKKLITITNALFLNENGQTVQKPIDVLIRVKKQASFPNFLLSLAAIILVVSLVISVVLAFLSQQDSSSNTQQTGGQVQTSLREEVKEKIPHFEKRYFLNQLDDVTLENFYTLYQAITSFEDYCQLPHDIKEEDLENLMILLHMECPELLQINFDEGLTSHYNLQNKTITQVQLKYTISQSEYETRYHECMSLIQKLQNETTEATDFEKELYVYRYLTEHCYYNIDAENAANAYGALIQKSAKCDGISLAMKWIMEEMGIPCLCVAGIEEGNPIGHAWNIIYINNQYYDLDLTADLRYSENSAPLLYSAYNVSEQWIRPYYEIFDVFTDFSPLPMSISTLQNYHVKNGTFIAKDVLDQTLLESLFFDAITANSSVCIQFESTDDWNTFLSEYTTYLEHWFQKYSISPKRYQTYSQEKYRTFYIEFSQIQ